MLELQTFITRMQTPSTKLKVKELREREEFWRALWSWMPDDVKYYCLRVGQSFRVMRRDYKGFIGELGQVKFTPSEIELTVYEKSYDYTSGKYYYENKVVKVPWAAIAWTECITDRLLAEEAEKPSLEPMPETEEVKLGA